MLLCCILLQNSHDLIVVMSVLSLRVSPPLASDKCSLEDSLLAYFWHSFCTYIHTSLKLKTQRLHDYVLHLTITLLCTSTCPYITNMTYTLTSLCIVFKCYIHCMTLPVYNVGHYVPQSLAVLADSMMWLPMESKHSFHTVWTAQF